VLIDIPEHLCSWVHEQNQGSRDPRFAELDTLIYQSQRPVHDDNQPTLVGIAESTAPHCTCAHPDDHSARHAFDGSPCRPHGRSDV
jgi:hypothetical protein